MSHAFLWLGYGLTFIGGLWIIVLAWQKGILWGVGCLLFPFLQLLYVGLNWRETKSAFLVLLAGFVALIVSAVLVP